MEKITGGVTAAAGFKASGLHCGMRKNKQKKDVALVVADVECSAAAVYTQNQVKGAPIAVTRENLADGRARAFICNSGNANTCTPDGEQVAREMCRLTAEAAGVAPGQIIVASTGVIGQPLNLQPIRDNVAKLAAALRDGLEAGDDAAAAIMTTDTKPKQAAYAFQVGGKTAVIGGMAKGSGMICPNMATMLCLVTTDAAISPGALREAIAAAVGVSFNMVSVDGDTSTNDMLAVMASGLCGNEEIAGPGPDFDAFSAALTAVCRDLARMIAADGEGATKLLECNVKSFADRKGAALLALSVVKSPLVKTAMFGADANWGRVLCALGYAGVPFDTEKVDVSFRSKAGTIAVCEDGKSLDFDEALAKAILTRDEVTIDVDMKCGEAAATAYGCDLSYEYVRINGDYRT